MNTVLTYRRLPIVLAGMLAAFVLLPIHLPVEAQRQSNRVEGLKGGAENERGEITLGALVKYVQEQVPKQVRLDLGQEKLQKPYAIVGGYKADELVVSVTTRLKPEIISETLLSIVVETVRLPAGRFFDGFAG